MNDLVAIVLAVGALGTASFGIVEGFKWTFIGLAGFRQIRKLLGDPVMKALQIAYGSEYLPLLKGQYRAERTTGELLKSIRQGARVGLTPETAGDLAQRVGVVNKAELKAVAAKLQKGKDLNDNQRNILGRYELALDARIDAALALANDKYIGYMRLLASGVSLVIAVLVWWYLSDETKEKVPLLTAIVIGLAAVPIAPVAKDVAKAIQSAARAMPRRK